MKSKLFLTLLTTLFIQSSLFAQAENTDIKNTGFLGQTVLGRIYTRDDIEDHPTHQLPERYQDKKYKYFTIDNEGIIKGYKYMFVTSFWDRKQKQEETSRRQRSEGNTGFWGIFSINKTYDGTSSDRTTRSISENKTIRRLTNDFEELRWHSMKYYGGMATIPVTIFLASFLGDLAIQRSVKNANKAIMKVNTQNAFVKGSNNFLGGIVPDVFKSKPETTFPVPGFDVTQITFFFPNSFLAPWTFWRLFCAWRQKESSYLATRAEDSYAEDHL